MGYIHKTIKRLATDAGGYLLVITGLAIGWLPGPGGIPLVVAGLGLLSINNPWAARLRKYVIKHSGRLLGLFFPANRYVQWVYDVLVAILLIIVSLLAFNHAAIWQLSLSIALFFIAIFIAAMNRDRFMRIKRKH